MYGQGISREGDVLDCAVEAKIVEKAGSWYSFNGERIGQGRENVKTFLADNKDILAQIEERLTGSIASLKPLNVDEDGVIIED
jgi:recombination protein RecA